MNMESSDLFLYGLIIVAALVIWLAIKVIKKVMLALLIIAVVVIIAAVVYFRFLQGGI